MMHNEIVDILLRAGIPASTKGFIYIHDALELMDKDSYYFSGKICALYAKIAQQNGANSAQVERAIRYAFEGALTRGNLESVGHYLDPVNTRNSNELRVLFLRWKQGTLQTEENSYDTISESAYSCGGNRERFKRKKTHMIPYQNQHIAHKYTARSLLR